ncbi:hypothetical protein QBC38DRAFT_439582 [Podospora fimiseda]|uniref:C2H2-type domain-containing protein n=1 Tax=Podospora fimiseda TaxID=252190 RepID=A0AAN7BYJ3_9PEZI|nr:hypothetical protein QBC38DRAFT_439582 [Podospora fimiseda]
MSFGFNNGLDAQLRHVPIESPITKYIRENGPTAFSVSSTSEINSIDVTQRELAEIHGFIVGLKVFRGLKKNGITDEQKILDAFMSATANTTDVNNTQDQIEDVALSPKMADNSRTEYPPYPHARQFDSLPVNVNYQARTSSMAVWDWKTEFEPGFDIELPNMDLEASIPNFFEEAVADRFEFRDFAPFPPAHEFPPNFEPPRANTAPAASSAKTERLTRDTIKRGVHALAQVDRLSRLEYTRFNEVLSQKTEHTGVFRHLADDLFDEVEWVARGQDVWENMVKGAKVTALTDILAFTSLSYVMSILRVSQRQIEHHQVLADLYLFEESIKAPEERAAFSFLAKQMWSGLHRSPAHSGPVQGPAESLLRGHAHELASDAEESFRFTQFSGVMPNLRNAPMSLAVDAFIKEPDSFFFALSGRGKSVAHSRDPPSRVICKAAKLLREHFFGPRKRIMKEMGSAHPDYPKFRALLVAAKPLVVRGCLQTQVEVQDFLLALSEEFLEPFEEQHRFAIIIRGDVLADAITKAERPITPNPARLLPIKTELAESPCNLDVPKVRNVTITPPPETYIEPRGAKRPRRATVSSSGSNPIVPSDAHEGPAAKIYRCLEPECDKTFESASGLSKHKMKHLGRTIRCMFPGCAYKSHRQDQTRKHFVTKHPGETLPLHLEGGVRGPTVGRQG